MFVTRKSRLDLCANYKIPTVCIVTLLPLKTFTYEFVNCTPSKNKCVLVLLIFSLLLLLLYYYLALLVQLFTLIHVCNNNYNYNSLSDIIILNYFGSIDHFILPIGDLSVYYWLFACNNLATIICVGGLAIVVALAYKWFYVLVSLLPYSFHVNYIRSFRITISDCKMSDFY